jgi:glycosyltransferase involved in cell wall biosynthesis
MDGYGGGYEEELKTFARSHGNRVTFLPPVGVEDLVTSLSGFNIGIVPYKPVSLNNYYATPNKVFEYIMAGLPVCVSNLPELWDIVTLNTVGSVFNPNDPKDIARSITAVESRYHVFSHNAQCAAKTKYNWETQSNQLINIYTKN